MWPVSDTTGRRPYIASHGLSFVVPVRRFRSDDGGGAERVGGARNREEAQVRRNILSRIPYDSRLGFVHH